MPLPAPRLLALLIAEIQLLDLLARPFGLAQKGEARGDAGIVGEAANTDASGQFRPAVARHQIFEDGLERDAMQWIVRLFLVHGAY